MSCPGRSLTLLHFGICLDIVQVHALDAQFNNKISKEINVEPYTFHTMIHGYSFCQSLPYATRGSLDSPVNKPLGRTINST
jgi:hypothetical protein